MMCGSKCFIVKLELNGIEKIKRVRARTPVNARKFIRRKYGTDARIISAIKEK